METTNVIVQAAEEYIARRERRAHPDGTFDKAGRFWPSHMESCECCRSIRTPSRVYPYSYMTHCRSLPHIAAKYGVDPKQVRRAVRSLGVGK